MTPDPLHNISSFVIVGLSGVGEKELTTEFVNMPQAASTKRANQTVESIFRSGREVEGEFQVMAESHEVMSATESICFSP
jgi:hypothetical protein